MDYFHRLILYPFFHYFIFIFSLGSQEIPPGELAKIILKENQVSVPRIIPSPKLDEMNLAVKTPTGAYLKAFCQGSEDLEKTMDRTLQEALESMKLKSVNLENLKEFSRKIVLQETLHQDDYFPLYHAYQNKWGLFFDLLNLSGRYGKFGKLDPEFNPHCPRLSGPPSDKNMTVLEYLGQLKSQTDKTQTAADGTISLDECAFAKQNAISVNMSLFGNVGTHNFESTLYYFLKSESITMPFDEAILDIFRKMGFYADNKNLQKERLAKYKDLYARYQSKAGGHLLQIFVRKNKIDEMVYPCWAYGYPYRLEEGKKKLYPQNFFTNSAFRPKGAGEILSTAQILRALVDRQENFRKILSVDPACLKGLDQGGHKVSAGKMKKILSDPVDRIQGRMVINENLFDTENIKVFRYSTGEWDINDNRKISASDREDFKIYEETLAQMFLEDIILTVRKGGGIGLLASPEFQKSPLKTRIEQGQ